MSPVLPMSAVVAALAVLMLLVRALQTRDWLGAEAGRKLVHTGMGAIALSFPWIFVEPWPVWTLAALAAAILGAVRFVPSLSRRFGRILGGVDRASLGDLLFPLGAASAFALAGQNRAAYCAAIGVLAFADTAGALVGTRWGRLGYTVAGGRKTIEGSIAVLAVAAACASAACVLLGRDSSGSALVEGAGVGLAAALVEAIAGFGLDNVLLPLVVVGIMIHWKP